MKLTSTLLTLTLLIPAVFSSPTPNSKRDLAEYAGIITDLTDATNEFSSWISEYSSGLITGPNLLAYSTDLLNAYIDAPGQIILLPPLSALDALSLVYPITDLLNATADMIDSLIGVKPILVADGLDDEFITWLGNLRGEMERLRDAIVGRVPGPLADGVYDTVNTIPEEVKKGEDAFMLEI
ncbi:hypothetical protein BJX63DRAFT_433978 [Aspergillus granulosus]|uniref:Uncharacterized protein n=1 Tax=Aspergillus granulosus TaxID=176169 RepID=A0ABR4H5M7_9EURO